MPAPSRMDTQEHGNGGAEAARVASRFARADADRMAELDRLIAKALEPAGPEPEAPPPARPTLCARGHPLDGVKSAGHGKIKRFCKTCHRDWQREWQRQKRAQARKAGEH